MDCKYPEIANSRNTTNMSHNLSQYHPLDNAACSGVSSSPQQLPIRSCVVKKMSLTEKAKGFVKLMEAVAHKYPLATADYYTPLAKTRYSDVVEKVEHFSRSSKTPYELNEDQHYANIRESEIKERPYIQKRWTAAYHTIKLLYELKDHVHAVLSAIKQRSICDLS
ncbi:hypothetical protein RF11_14260 [Thelohanellus kitauei]|uniref:Uncharacterized protein n=1 Tax=Thelohanellus kitauei TaxID=669202 RepID=A0A0C2MVJ3_THEKT|nr:hypothetical protein RF11_14260 [Thelohanellus kitauei]